MTRSDEAAGKRRLAGLLATRFLVRFHLTLILGFSFAVGLLATKLMLLSGLDSPLWRWPLAVLAAYGGFLLGVRVWLAYVGLGRHLGNGDDSGADGGADGGLGDLPGVDFSGSGGGGSRGVLDAVGELPLGRGGGNFGGGGASGDFGSTALTDAGGGADFSAPASGLKLPEVDVDLGGVDEGCLPILLLFAIALLLFTVFGVGAYLVWQAPFLLAEAAFEAALAAGLIRTTRRITAPGWVGNTVRASVLPLLGILVLSILLAALVTHFVPDARTLLEAVRLLLAAA